MAGRGSDDGQSLSIRGLIFITILSALVVSGVFIFTNFFNQSEASKYASLKEENKYFCSKQNPLLTNYLQADEVIYVLTGECNDLRNNKGKITQERVKVDEVDIKRAENQVCCSITFTS